MKYSQLGVVCLSFAAVIGMPDASSGQDAGEAMVNLSFETDDPYQAMFSIAINEVENGNYASAIKMLRSLFRVVKTRRIQLELARALFLDRQYKEAQQLFLEVFEDPETPLNVRENVKLYLDEADAALGQLKFSFAIVSDSNPLGFTDARKINIGGQTLIVAEPEENKTVVGAKYGLNATKALTDDASVSVYMNTNFTDFEGGDFDRLEVDGGFLFAPRNLPRYRARIGLEKAYYSGSHLYDFPYVALIFIPKPYNQFRLRSEVQYGRLDVAEANHLDAHDLNVILHGNRTFANDTWLASNVFFEMAETEEDAYSYVGGGIGGELSVPVNDYWGVKFLGSIGLREYDGTDPFFGSTRKDDSYTLGISFFSRLITLFGREPEIGIQYERRNSNLDFYEYDRIQLTFRLAER